MESPITALRIACVLSSWEGQPGRCQWCDKDLAGQSRRKVWCSKECGQAFEDNHIWNVARHKARKRAKYRCCRDVCSNPKGDLEVNHINPLVGAGYGPSCFHHASNLEVLCRPHHQIETNRQRSERKEAKLQEASLLSEAIEEESMRLISHTPPQTNMPHTSEADTPMGLADPLAPFTDPQPRHPSQVLPKGTVIRYIYPVPSGKQQYVYRIPKGKQKIRPIRPVLPTHGNQ